MADGTREGNFDRLFDAHYADVLAFAIRRTDGRSAAEDAAAETFAIAWRKLEVVPAEPLGWLYAVTRNVLANERRSERRRGRLLRRLSSERAVGAHQPDPAVAVGESDLSLRALASLSEGQREVLMLVAWEGADAETASAALGCTPGAFRIRLHRARKAFEAETARAGEPAVSPAQVKETP